VLSKNLNTVQRELELVHIRIGLNHSDENKNKRANGRLSG